MKRYELVRMGTGFWQLFFWDDEFKIWEHIMDVDAENTTIKSIYDLVKGNNKSGFQIVLKYVLKGGKRWQD